MKEENFGLKKLKEENFELEKLKNENFELKNENFELKEKIIREEGEKNKELTSSSSVRNSSKTAGAGSVKNVFGVTLKKQGGSVNYIKEAREESRATNKKTAEIFKGNLDLLLALRKNVCENFNGESPSTVSSNSDILEVELPELDFSSPSNDALVLEAEKKLLEKEKKRKEKKKKEKDENLEEIEENIKT